MEQEELELVEDERDDEMFSSEAYALLAELNSEIAYGESLGVFTPSEAAEWYAGAEACTKISHLEGLLGYIDRFIASGQARLKKLEKAIDNDLLTSGEQLGYLSEGYAVSYEDKGELISEIGSLVKHLESLKSELTSVLNRSNAGASEKGAMISKFYSTSASSKGGVIGEAASLKPETPGVEPKAAEVKPAASDPKTGTSNIEIVENPAIKPTSDPKAECLMLVDDYCRHNQFSQAASLLEAEKGRFNLAEYRGLLKKVEEARIAEEIPALKAALKAA